MPDKGLGEIIHLLRSSAYPTEASLSSAIEELVLISTEPSSSPCLDFLKDYIRSDIYFILEGYCAKSDSSFLIKDYKTAVKYTSLATAILDNESFPKEDTKRTLSCETDSSKEPNSGDRIQFGQDDVYNSPLKIKLFFHLRYAISLHKCSELILAESTYQFCLKLLKKLKESNFSLAERFNLIILNNLAVLYRDENKTHISVLVFKRLLKYFGCSH